eukprot:jgi/Chlat1/8306/Chrsp78S07721
MSGVESVLSPFKGHAADPGNSPEVKVPPPVFQLACIVLGVMLKFFYKPFIMFTEEHYFVKLLAAAFALSTAVFIFYMSLAELAKNKTSVKHHQKVSAIVTTGPFGQSRNPIYMSFFFLQAGLAAAMNTYWLVLTAIPFVLYIVYIVIPAEEDYMRSKFGMRYVQYTKKVRRWM